jgi:Concanavalin A-like lectin/glucanases superfamily/Viral BACON domain
MATVVFKSGAQAPPPPPALSVTPASLSFTGTQGGASPAAKTLAVSNAGGGTLNWTASETASWLAVSPAGGTNNGTITVTPNITGLTAGTYNTDVTVSAAGAGGSPKTIPVTFTVNPPAPPSLSVTPTSLSFSATQGGSSPAGKSLTIANTGGGSMSWTASDDAAWLSVSPASGTNNGTVTVTADVTGLAAGTYNANVTIDGGAITGSPQTIPVTLTVAPPPPPVLSLTPATMTFSATQGGANPAFQNASVTNTGTGSLDVTASSDKPWLTVTPASATAPATLSIGANVSGLAAGTYTGNVTVTATTPGATGSPKTIAVTLNVTPPASASLVGAWGFNEASGTTAADSSGNGNNGTITNATHTTTGKFGGALSFNGSNAFVQVPDANSLDLTTGMTLEAWVNPTAVGTAWRSVILKEQPANLIYALYAGDSKGKAAADVFTTSDIGLSGTTNTPLNAWTHLAATYDGANLRIYVNGVQAVSKAVTGAIKTSTGALRIGGNSIWGEWFAGQIDEVRVYNKALTAAQVQADMAAPVG